MNIFNGVPLYTVAATNRQQPCLEMSDFCFCYLFLAEKWRKRAISSDFLNEDVSGFYAHGARVIFQFRPTAGFIVYKLGWRQN